MVSVGKLLRGVRCAADKASVRRIIREKTGTSRLSGLRNEHRVVIHDAIFSVENKIESKGGGRSDDPRVVQLRAARNMLLDDMGWNEPNPRRQAASSLRSSEWCGV